MSIPRVDGLLTDPREMGRHKAGIRTILMDTHSRAPKVNFTLALIPSYDAPNLGGPVDHRQPVENLCVSYYETYT